VQQKPLVFLQFPTWLLVQSFVDPFILFTSTNNNTCFVCTGHVVYSFRLEHPFHTYQRLPWQQINNTQLVLFLLMFISHSIIVHRFLHLEAFINVMGFGISTRWTKSFNQLGLLGSFPKFQNCLKKTTSSSHENFDSMSASSNVLFAPLFFL